MINYASLCTSSSLSWSIRRLVLFSLTPLGARARINFRGLPTVAEMKDSQLWFSRLLIWTSAWFRHRSFSRPLSCKTIKQFPQIGAHDFRLHSKTYCLQNYPISCWFSMVLKRKRFCWRGAWRIANSRYGQKGFSKFCYDVDCRRWWALFSKFENVLVVTSRWHNHLDSA